MQLIKACLVIGLALALLTCEPAAARPGRGGGGGGGGAERAARLRRQHHDDEAEAAASDWDEHEGRTRRHHGGGGVAGPIHTFVKTDKNANFKWGVRHHVGSKYS